LRAVSDTDSDLDFCCAASTDLILDYGQYAISQSGLGHIMYSAATAQSTMDFSNKPLTHGVVDSPPKGVMRTRLVSSPSPLKAQAIASSPRNRDSCEGVAPRKLYDENGLAATGEKVPETTVSQRMLSEDASCPVNSLQVRIPSFPALVFLIVGHALRYTYSVLVHAAFRHAK
jgi:hypothetical protein